MNNSPARLSGTSAALHLNSVSAESENIIGQIIYKKSEKWIMLLEYKLTASGWILESLQLAILKTNSYSILSNLYVPKISAYHRTAYRIIHDLRKFIYDEDFMWRLISSRVQRILSCKFAKEHLKLFLKTRWVHMKPGRNPVPMRLPFFRILVHGGIGFPHSGSHAVVRACVVSRSNRNLGC